MHTERPEYARHSRGHARLFLAVDVRSSMGRAGICRLVAASRSRCLSAMLTAEPGRAEAELI